MNQLRLRKLKKKGGNFYTIEFANELTGFGDTSTCTLCIRVNSCSECIYFTFQGKHCNNGINYKTYKRIVFANTPVKLHNAYRARAKHMQTLLP